MSPLAAPIAASASDSVSTDTSTDTSNKTISPSIFGEQGSPMTSGSTTKSGIAAPAGGTVSVASMYLDRVAATPDRKAFTYPSGGGWKTMSWKESRERVAAIACGLRALGLEGPPARLRLLPPGEAPPHALPVKGQEEAVRAVAAEEVLQGGAGGPGEGEALQGGGEGGGVQGEEDPAPEGEAV